MIQTGFVEQFNASQDGACTNLFENFSENNLKGDLSKDTTENPPLLSLVNTFNTIYTNAKVMLRIRNRISTSKT
jgi:hypothetical protein